MSPWVDLCRCLPRLYPEQSFDFSLFKARKSTTKQMRHEDAVRHAKQDMSEVLTITDDDNDNDLPLMPPLDLEGEMEFESTIRSSTTDYLSVFSSDSDRSGLAPVLTSDPPSPLSAPLNAPPSTNPLVTPSVHPPPLAT
jgi:hypothetical protein